MIYDVLHSIFGLKGWERERKKIDINSDCL